ncbi:MAG TPA: hypothetical protein IAB85_08875 [Candidatus Coprenecus merdigallinarum]|nr:hypothetical protein [Candidatus Coprenecus merdigallinarum]
MTQDTNPAPTSLLTAAIATILLTAGCAGNTSSTGNSTASTHESNFILTDEGRIHVKTQVDTLTLTLIFDSGGAGEMTLETACARLLNAVATEGLHRKNRIDSASIGGQNTGNTYAWCLSPNSDQDLFPGSDGIICPQYAIDRRIWEINMTNSYIRIHERDTVPPGAAIFPMRIESGRYLYTKFPVTVIRGRDTMKTDREILIDYGSTSALWFEHSPLHSDPAVMEFFTSSPQPQVVEKEWCEEYTLMADKIILPDGMGTLTSSTDNLKISLTVLNEEYYHEESVLKYPAAIMGIGILRHWNVMLDLKNKRLILFPGARATVNTAAPSFT